TECHAAYMAINGRGECSNEIEILTLFIKTNHARHLPGAVGKLLQLSSRSIIEIEVIITVSLALPDKPVIPLFHEEHGILGFHIFGMTLCEERPVNSSRDGIIPVQLHPVLLPVE